MKVLCVMVLLLGSVVSLHAQENEAEKLFRAMEKKIVSSLACEIKFEYKMQKGSAKGTMLVAGEKQFHLTISGLEDVLFGRMVVIGDGASVSMSTAKASWETPCNLRTWVGYPFCRGGLFVAVHMIPATRGENKQLQPDAKDSSFQVYNFKLVGEEKIGDIKTTKIEYKVGSRRGEQDDSPITLWIDSATQLPVQRLIKGSHSEPNLMIKETYQCKLDPKVDPKIFEIPK